MNRKIIILVFFLFISINFVYAIGGLTFSTSLDRKKPTDSSATTIPKNEVAEFSSGDQLFWNYNMDNRKTRFRTSVCFYLKDSQNDKTYDITELILRIVNEQKGCTDENNNPIPSAPSYCPIKLDNVLIGISNQEETGNILRHVFTPTSLPSGEYELIAQLREPTVRCSNPSSISGSIISENVISAVPIAESVNYFKFIVTPSNLQNNDFTIIEDDSTLILEQQTQSDEGLVYIEYISDSKVAEKFYMTHHDIYDFLVIFTSFQPKTQTPSNNILRSEIQGIGLPIYNNPNFPSKKLKQFSFLSNIDLFDLNNRLTWWELFHEVSHFWLIYVGDYRDCADPVADVCKRNTGFKVNLNGHWDLNVDSWWRDERGYAYAHPNHGLAWVYKGGYCEVMGLSQEKELMKPMEFRFNDLDLYLMGLIPQNNAKPIYWYELEGGTGPKCNQRTITVNDIINMYGQRNPPYPSAQRDFSIAFILLTKKGEKPTKSQRDKMHYIVSNFPKEWRAATRGTSTLLVP